jgi:V/A-type H+/Na+-transporting ATPase subunit D
MSVENVSPTRINLIQTKKTLRLAISGRDILERKRDILIRELRHSIYDAEIARGKLNEALAKAYVNLRSASMATGIDAVEQTAYGSGLKAEFLFDERSIMGVTVPLIDFQSSKDVKPDYGFAGTSVELDETFKQFYSTLSLIAELAKHEGTSFQIANDIGKTQRRVNALNHVLIPLYRKTVKQIESVLEEKEREEFVRTKRIKHMIEERELL